MLPHRFFNYFSGDQGAIVGGIIFGVMAFVILVWTATVGDEWVTAKVSLLFPDVASGLIVAIGRDEQRGFAEAMAASQMGFDIVHVTLTSNRVLYVVFSMMVFGVYLIPK